MLDLRLDLRSPELRALFADMKLEVTEEETWYCIARAELTLHIYQQSEHNLHRIGGRGHVIGDVSFT